MAIYAVNFKILDIEGRVKSREVLFDVADEAALLAAAASFETDYQAIQKCGIVDYTYRRSVAVNNTPDAGSNVDAGFTTLWDTALAVNPTTKVIDPKDSIKDGQGGIDLSDALVIAWFENYTVDDARLNINNPTQPTDIIRATLDK